MFKEVQQNMLR